MGAIGFCSFLPNIQAYESLYNQYSSKCKDSLVLFLIYHAFGCDARKLDIFFRSFESIMQVIYIHENRAIILGIKTEKPRETPAVFGLQSFRPHVLVGEDGFASLRRSHGLSNRVTREDGFVCISARRAEIEVRLGQALAGNARPRCI